MRKLLKPRELLATGIQLMVFALLLPFMGILLGMVMEAAPAAKDKYAAAVVSYLPLADTIQAVVTGINSAMPGKSTLDFAQTLMVLLEENVVTAMYLGTWLYIFRVVFRELIPIRGLPIFQVVCGLFFGALTYAFLENPMMRYCAMAFLVVAAVVLTFFVQKAGWKKLLSILGGVALQSYLAILTVSYVAVLSACVQGLYANLTQAVTAVVTVTLLWIVYIATGYLVREK